ncbi:MAG TPA: histidine phosphatase family protein [Thermomicrobiales bacterium]|nr:histidine phosphatase family protein [Thermomicrobiales bacterium]
MERHDHLTHPYNRVTHLLLVRHGRTEGNRRNILQGTSDFPLDALGLLQAQRIAARLTQEPPADLLLASPLSRALTTAQIIGERVGLEPVVVPDLHEMSFGDYEGLVVDEVRERRPDLLASLDNPASFNLVWPGGESRRGFHERVRSTFHAILHTHAEERIIVVAHGGVIGAFLGQITGSSPNDPRLFELVNCGLTHVEVRGDHTLLHLRNDASHLADLVDPDAPKRDATCD